jgi:hypothetical protein
LLAFSLYHSGTLICRAHGPAQYWYNFYFDFSF